MVPVTRIVVYRKLGYTEMTITFTVLSLITLVTCRNINVHKYFCSFWLLIVSFVYGPEWKLFLVPMRITVSNKRDLLLDLLWTNFQPLGTRLFFIFFFKLTLFYLSSIDNHDRYFFSTPSALKNRILISRVTFNSHSA